MRLVKMRQRWRRALRTLRVPWMMLVKMQWRRREGGQGQQRGRRLKLEASRSLRSRRNYILCATM
jgi:hypothetical protein